MNELTCAEFVELLTAFLDGALDAESTKRFHVHLTMCGGCQPYLDQFRHTVRALDDLPSETVSAEIRDALLRAFHSPHD